MNLREIFFRAIRRLTISAQKGLRQFQLFRLKSLYPARFFYQADFNFGRNFSLFFDDSKSAVHIGKSVLLRDYCQIRSGMSGNLTIGDRVFFNNYCSIICSGEITIGNDCQFGESVKFYDHNHHYTTAGKNINEQGYKVGKIRIGNNCWMGSNVIILRNVEIGDNVVIGAGCVIHQSIPSNTVVKNQQQLDLKQYSVGC